MGFFDVLFGNSRTSGKCGKNLIWKLNGGTLTISGKGDMDDYLWDYSRRPPNTPWRDNYKAIDKIIIYDGVNSIGNFAFFMCRGLREIKIPNGVATIGNNAFSDCNSLTEIKLPNGVMTIGIGAFWCCESLREIKVPNSVKYISNGAFYCCNSLAEIKIPDDVTYIGESAFLACRSLTEIRIPDGVTNIGEKAFYNCTSLEKIYYPAGRGFEKNLSQGNHAQLIPYNSAPVIKPKPQPVKRYTAPPAQVNPTPQPVIKPEPQAAVESLRWKVEGKTLTVGGVSEIKSYSYSETPWRDSLRDIQKIIIEEGVEKISANAFAECKRLEQLTIPVSVKTIGDGAFTYCYCGDRKINDGQNVVWSLEDGTLMIKKNPAAKNESNFSTGYETWQVVEGNITGVKIERGIVPSKRFFDWLSRMGDGVEVSF